MTEWERLGRGFGTVTLDVEVIQQWLDWLDNIVLGDNDDLLRADLKEVLAHPERCQPRVPR